MMNKKWMICFIAQLIFSLSIMAQDLSLYQKHWLINGKDTLPYRLLLPQNYDAAKKYPVIFFLHGSGERGNDNEKQLVHGGKLFLQDDVRSAYPAIVVFPQCPQTTSWGNVKSERDSSGKRIFHFQPAGEPTIAMSLLQSLLKKVMDEYPADKKRVYLGGLSMGGMGTFELAGRNPKLFAAAFPICGGSDPKNAKDLKKTAWWVFHGAKDDVVPPRLSEEMVAALKKQKASVKFTVYPEAAHNSWDAAFAEKDLMPWLFLKHK